MTGHRVSVCSWKNEYLIENNRFAKIKLFFFNEIIVRIYFFIIRIIKRFIVKSSKSFYDKNRTETRVIYQYIFIFHFFRNLFQHRNEYILLGTSVFYHLGTTNLIIRHILKKMSRNL